MDKQLKTGTTTVGIVCKMGVVLAADMRATAGTMIVDKRAEKVQIMSDDFALTWAGNVSDAQLMTRLARAELKLKEVRTGKPPSTKEAANLLAGLQYSSIRRPSMLPGIAHFLLGGRDAHGVHLYDLFPDGSVTKITDYVSSGSGSVFAYGVLETNYDANLSIEQGVQLAVKVINTALQRDSASGNGINVVVVSAEGVKKVMTKELIAKL
ncbi:MAG TPA: proteasome subunit beta [Candidatus Nanoarchaeia archaeon]|nr:proteasome subunit beta [Candidatus Nanoarchaeia archaeon]